MISLLIACMAGPAMASYGSKLLTADSTPGNQIDLPTLNSMKSGDSLKACYLLTGIPVENNLPNSKPGKLYGYPKPIGSPSGTHLINALVTVEPGSGTGLPTDITVEWIDHQNIGLTINSLFNVHTVGKPPKVTNEGDYLDEGNIIIKLNAAPQAEGTVYDVLIPIATPGQNNDWTYGKATVRASTSVTVQNIPEFPTIALPVAGVLGLVFAFVRKKEEL